MATKKEEQIAVNGVVRILELEAELAALRADAERYRWLVENAKHIPWSKQFPGLNADTGLDAAIDAAIAPAKEQL